MADLSDPLFSPGAPIASTMNTTSAAPGEGQSFDFWRLYAAITKRLWLIITVFIVTVTAVTIWTMQQVRIYRAEASIVIDQTPPQVLRNTTEVVDLGSGNFWSTKEYFETQYRVMKSRAVADKVVSRLGLDRDYDFLHIPSNLDPGARARALKAADPIQMVIDKISVLPVKDSRIVNVVIEDPSPQRAAELANAVAEEYIEQNVERKLTTTHGASAFLADQLQKLKKALEDSEKALYEFKRVHDVLSTSLEARQNMSAENTVKYNADLSEASIKRSKLEARRESLARILAASKGSEFQAESFKPIADNTVVNELKREYFRLQAERVELSETYLDGHPRRVAIDERIKKVRADIVHETDVVLRAAAEELREVEDQEKRMRGMLETAKHEAIAVNKLELQYSLLKREKDQNQTQYEFMMKRQKEVDISGLLRTNNIRMLDSALVPRVAARPNRGQNVSIAALLGLILGLGLVVLIEFLDNTIKSQDDVEHTLGLPLLGILPSIPHLLGSEVASRDNTAQRDLYVSANPKSSISECARAIRTSLMFSSPDRPAKVLLIASCGPREGKSTCAVSIGITMAQSGNRVLVIDGDLRRPRLHRTFGAPSAQGLSTLILGESTPEQAIKSTGVERLFVLPAGPVPPNPAELLQSHRYSDVIKDLASRFDRVIIDSPPVGVVTDALVMSAQADGVVMVLRAGATPKRAALRGRRTLLDVKAHIYGAVLNDVDLGSRAGQYYYYYRYGYYPSDKYPAQAGDEKGGGSSKGGSRRTSRSEGGSDGGDGSSDGNNKTASA